MKETTFRLGEWAAICDRCGFRFRSVELQREWTGLRVCRSCLDPRHPQEHLRGNPDRQKTAWTRPEQTDTSPNTTTADDL